MKRCMPSLICIFIQILLMFAMLFSIFYYINTHLSILLACGMLWYVIDICYHCGVTATYWYDYIECTLIYVFYKYGTFVILLISIFILPFSCRAGLSTALLGLICIRVLSVDIGVIFCYFALLSDALDECIGYNGLLHTYCGALLLKQFLLVFISVSLNWGLKLCLRA